METYDLGQRLLEMRIEEINLREHMINKINDALKENLWRKLGYKSPPEFCRKELGYDSHDTRSILIRVGYIRPNTSLKSDDPVIQTRIDLLLRWRKQKAFDNRLPAFRVFSNRTLLALAESGPKREEDLAAVSGIGPRRMREFGRELLETLSQT